jgi:hypothetical protein
VAQQGSRWLLACALWAGLVPLGSQASERGADGRYDERRSSHFVLLQDVDLDRRSGWRGSRRFELEVLAVLESAHHDLGARLGLELARPVEVVVHDPGVFDGRFASLFRFPAGGFYGGSIQVRGDVQVTWLLERTLRHELVHAAFDQASRSLVLPGWINEGTAEWFEQRSLGKRHPTPAEYAVLRQAAAGGALPSVGQLSVGAFGHLPPERAHLAYLESYALVVLLVQERGEDRYARFLRDVIRLRNLDAALRRHYRMDPQDLDEALRGSLR